MSAVTVRIEGLKDVFASLSALESKLGKKILRSAMNAASKILLWEVRGQVKGTVFRTGALYKSLGRKVKVYRDSGVVVAIVGPRSGFVGTPTRYAHLVERHKPFMAPSLDRVRNLMMAAIVNTIRNGIEDATGGG